MSSGAGRAGYGGRGQWAQALVLSLAAHGAAAAAMLGVVPGFDRPGPAPAPAPIEVRSLALDAGGEGGGADQAGAAGSGIEAVVLRPLAGAEAAPVASGGSVLPPPVPRATAAATVSDAATGQRLLPSQGLSVPAAPVVPVALPPAITPAPLAPEATTDNRTAAAVPGAAGPAADGETIPADSPQGRAVAGFVAAIRGRLAEPCLIALPQARGGEVELTVVGGSEQGVADYMAALTGTGRIEVPLAERSVLLDARQCPAMAFARAAAGYPVYPLRIEAESRRIDSGTNLRGRVAGGGGAPVSLLLVDDNGVVQDLGRFTRPTADGLEFDVPMRRAGVERDTSQILLAIAAPAAPRAVTAEAGQMAERMFAALGRELGEAPRVGVLPFYLR